MTADLLTIAGNTLSHFILTDAGPRLGTSWQPAVAGRLACLAFGVMAALMRVPLWICWSAMALMAAKELAFDLPHGAYSWVILAGTNLDLGMPLLAYLIHATLPERLQPRPAPNPRLPEQWPQPFRFRSRL